MTRQFAILAAIFAILVVRPCSASAAEGETPFRLNTIGYLPDRPKTATLAESAERFAVVDLEDGRTVFEGTVNGPRRNPDTNETLYTADFTELDRPGVYALEAEGLGRSPAFRVGADVYNGVFDTVMKGMYLWRCGTAVSGTHDGTGFSHGPCHMNDAWLDHVGQPGVHKDGTGGWHDAGDYNKYIVNAAVTVGTMFKAWEMFPAIRNRAPGIPERGGAIPDFLDELKWEMEWVLRMEAPDGSVYHKLSAERFSGFVLAEWDRSRRYFSPWSSAATAGFAAMTAMAGRIYEPYDPAFAARCRGAAVRARAFLEANPQNHRADLSAFSTGAYQTDDAGCRLWAAAELWETLGDKNYLDEFERRAGRRDRLVETVWDWGNPGNLGVFTYLLSGRPGKDPSLHDRAASELAADANFIVATARNHGYARPLGTRYFWGCNGAVARQCLNLTVADRLSPDPGYADTALAALDHLFGRNYYGRSQVTGLGHNPPLNPHDRRSGADNIREPWPGYLVGGGHSAKGWSDEEASYETNEIAINWNGALIYALSAFVHPEGGETGVPRPLSGD